MRRRFRGFVVVLSVTIAAPMIACTLLVGTDGLSGGATDGDNLNAPADAVSDAFADDASRGDAGAEAASDAGDCPSSGRGPTMVRVGGDAGFCIDTTEVTNAQYAAFLGAPPDPSTQDPICSFNTSFVPGGNWGVTPSNAKQPVVLLDWCDAYAFCKWAGKRLCGKIGGGADTTSNHANPVTNQFYFACTKGGLHDYPYGDTYDPNACNGVDHGVGAVVDVGSMAGCNGGFDGVFDLVGNVDEWQDACDGDAGATDKCLDGPGSFRYPPDAGLTGTRCDYADISPRNGHFDDIGFRCCGP